MNIGVLGTGTVGSTIGTKLIQLGHRVKMGSRTATNEKAAAWVAANGKSSSQGTYAEAALFGDILFNCTAGSGSLEALNAAGEKNLGNKIFIDLANPLDFSKGMPPSLTVANTDSLGEQIQRTFPHLKVVKTLNTVNCNVMVNPALVPGVHDMLMCGNDAAAKFTVKNLLVEWFGWKSVIDLGDITNSRGMEPYVLLWIRLWGIMKTSSFNIHIVK